MYSIKIIEPSGSFSSRRIGKYKILSYTAGVGLEGVQAPLPRGDRERSDHQRGVSPYGQENSELKSYSE